jgi:hypothetical protein
MEFGQILEVTIITTDRDMLCGGHNNGDVRIKRCFAKRVKYRQLWMVEVIGILRKPTFFNSYRETYLVRPITLLSKYS